MTLYVQSEYVCIREIVYGICVRVCKSGYVL